MNKWVLCLLMLFSAATFAQTAAQKPKMVYMGAYDSGQASVSIHKLFDPTEDVVCYLLMPDQAGRKEGLNGGWIYEGNSVGAMSCVKARVHITSAAPSDPNRNKSRGKK